MVMNVKLKPLIKNILIPLIVGAVAGFLTKDGVEDFNMNAVKPIFSPPSWVFPVVWTALYVLMGIAAYLIETTGGRSRQKTTALAFYYVQLIFNFAWSFLFFNFSAYLLSAVWIVILWVLILITIVLFHGIRKSASYLLIPYLLWVAFAAVLNISIYLLN